MRMKQKKIFLEKKNSKWPTKKNLFFKIANSRNFFTNPFWAYVGQPHDYLGWAKAMPFASINPTNPRTNEKICRIGDFEK